jgi:O-antigen ligase
MKNSSKTPAELAGINLPTLILFSSMFLILTVMALLISGGMGIKLLVLIIGIIASAICIFNTELALYLILFSMLFSPEFNLGGELAEGRSFVVRIEDIIIFIVFLSWFIKTAVYKGVGLLLKTPLNQPIMLYVFASLFSTLLGVISGNVGLLSGSLYVFKYMEYFLVFFIFVNNITERDQIIRFIIAAFLVALFTGIYASIQIPFGVRVSAPFEGESGEPNTLGGYLILIISVAGGFLLTATEQRVKLYLTVLTAILALPFIFTLSRSSWVAAIPMFFLFFFLTDKKINITLTLLAVIIVSPILLPHTVTERVTTTFIPDPDYERTERIGNLGLDSSTSARIHSFRYSLSKWKQKPLFGWGVTGVGIIDSMYFRLLAETGIVGLLAFLFLIYTIVRYLYDTFRKTQDPLLSTLSLGMLAGTAALLGHSIGAASFIIVRIMEPYWFFMACIFTLREIEKKWDNRAEEAARP